MSYFSQTCPLFVPPGCGKLTGVSNPITVRASGSRFGSWMTDTMIPSSDNRVSLTFPHAHPPSIQPQTEPASRKKKIHGHHEKVSSSTFPPLPWFDSSADESELRRLNGKTGKVTACVTDGWNPSPSCGTPAD